MFNIRALDKENDLVAIVTAISYENPLSELNEVELMLKSTIAPITNGRILFDLACSNGFEWNRFMSLEFENGLLQLSSAKIIDSDEVAQELLEQQSHLFMSNVEYTQNAVFTQDELFSFQSVC
ncbi:type II toxin-antitoxin system RnlB family antitoxin [Vibrio vulnificus]|uniref:type II toxin-antitoxin system RnlB family antitoxin n=1 Tax=Vibrio vulnificus TaxID=672 RepID=UPI00102D0E98|nr:type II toxin-antitoxin system RnlB family antitoxin [Vibrio vulnificus]RZR08148.1 type II toxin-antitoxin system RnlB family antitoxin [Vibrio vulnificus]